MSTVDDVRSVLDAVVAKTISVDEASSRLSSSRYLKLEGLAELDLGRSMRTGFPEVVLGSTKDAEEIHKIAQALLDATGALLVTRVSQDKADNVLSAKPKLALKYNAKSQTLTSLAPPAKRTTPHKIALVSGGTSDLPVVLEAKETLEFCGWTVEQYNDVGVAGLERLLKICPELRSCDVIIAVAGMEGALPTVLAGLVPTPIIAIPTSVGYGVSKDGMAALHGMLSSCAPGLCVVNIDNGFGAAVAAHRILLGKAPRESKEA